MPLLKSKSKKAVSYNIKELLNSYKSKGTIGTSKPSSILKARKQAVAIAFGIKKGA